jgi:hypothetical protein
MAVSLSANVRNRRKGRDNHTDREGPQTTHLPTFRGLLAREAFILCRKL